MTAVAQIATPDVAETAMTALSRWDLAGIAAALLTVAPHALGGIQIKAPAGPARDAWLDTLRDLLDSHAPIRRLPASTGDDRLLGGLDLSATLAAGRPVAQRGLLAESDCGIIVIPMAERLEAGAAAHLAAALDRGIVATERDGLTLVSEARIGVIALDEGEADDPALPVSLSERLAFHIDLTPLSHRDATPLPFTAGDIARARQALPDVAIDDDALQALAGLGAALGVPSIRRLSQAVLAARCASALNGESQVTPDAASLAAALVFAPRATRLPASEPAADEPVPEPPETETDTPPDPAAEPTSETRPLDDVVLEAALAAMPAGLLAQLTAGELQARSRRAGKAGAQQKIATRGRKIGTRAADLRSGRRIDLIDTLKSAAPWQSLRRREVAGDGPLIRVDRSDFRVSRYRHRAETTTIFVVDASGSSALQRLAEAKGAVRLLLAECYIRRDEVALIAFRGQGAEILLPPTRALTRAQRALSALPGGGGTPVAAGLELARHLATQVARDGRTPVLVIMTDGKANVARDGAHGRSKAQDDARTAARQLAATGHATILIDTSPQPQALAQELAGLLKGRYLPLPHADARRVAAVIAAANSSQQARGVA